MGYWNRSPDMDPGMPLIVHEYLTKGMSHTFTRVGGVLMPVGLGHEYASWFGLPHVARFVEAMKQGREYMGETPGLITTTTQRNVTLLSYEVPLRKSVERFIESKYDSRDMSMDLSMKKKLRVQPPMMPRQARIISPVQGEVYVEEEDMTSEEDFEEENLDLEEETD